MNSKLVNIMKSIFVINKYKRFKIVIPIDSELNKMFEIYHF